ncbi:MAG TPA: hypothetical protein VNO50_03965 [Pyrinomonadaceae bacterium]|nr:hypothetical protein [Pyrinomonadaceae bacterium]
MHKKSDLSGTVAVQAPRARNVEAWANGPGAVESNVLALKARNNGYGWRAAMNATPIVRRQLRESG